MFHHDLHSSSSSTESGLNLNSESLLDSPSPEIGNFPKKKKKRTVISHCPDLRRRPGRRGEAAPSGEAASKEKVCVFKLRLSAYILPA
jgi:hypothetical protein